MALRTHTHTTHTHTHGVHVAAWPSCVVRDVDVGDVTWHVVRDVDADGIMTVTDGDSDVAVGG